MKRWFRCRAIEGMIIVVIGYLVYQLLLWLFP